MNVALRRTMTRDEFLAWEERQPERWGFDGFQPMAMVGGTVAHSAVCVNLVAALKARLRGGPCRVFVDGLRIAADHSIRYPDAVVAYGPNPATATIAGNPVVVFEVESPGTAHLDFGLQNQEYRATRSILRYTILAQDRVAATIFGRRGTEWIGSLVTEPGAILAMPEIGVELPLSELYDGVLDD